MKSCDGTVEGCKANIGGRTLGSERYSELERGMEVANEDMEKLGPV